MTTSRRDELKALIKQAREDYYNLCPKVSDQVYDAWVDELAQIEPEAKEVVAVGAPPPQHSVWEKVQHEIPMGSLNKANTFSEMEEWVGKTGTSEFLITHKIDGSSMELVYDRGVLKRCVTRGDGTIGEDVTANVSRVPNIPKTIPLQGRVIVRGEIVMLKSVFEEKYSSEYANPRNTAAAKVREKKNGGVDCENLKFLAYWIHADALPETLSGVMFDLAVYGFEVPDYVAGEFEYVAAKFMMVSGSRDKVPYEIDGMVVSVNSLAALEELGSHGLRPRGQIAWKFDAASRETRVTDVKWQVGPSGRITPVAVVEPVNIGGVVITNISLHNLDMFRQLKLRQGSRVLVSRRNDVIPYIEMNMDLEAA